MASTDEKVEIVLEMEHRIYSAMCNGINGSKATDDEIEASIIACVRVAVSISFRCMSMEVPPSFVREVYKTIIDRVNHDVLERRSVVI